METKREATIETYNKSASALAEYFKGIGPRVHDIDIAFELAGNPVNPRIVEIGCGDGRDAKEIISRTDKYTGFDISEGMISIANDYVPNACFERGDAVTYDYPENTDIVFAFASLLHLDWDEVDQVFNKVYASLKSGGIFYISSKYRDGYSEDVKQDEYGERLFYFYNAELITVLAGPGYESVFEDKKTIGSTEWFEIALRKI